MQNKKTILKAVLIAAICLTLVSAFFIYRDRTTVYKYEENSTIDMGTVVTQKVYSENAHTHIQYINSYITAFENLISRRVESSAVYELNESGTVADSQLSQIISQCLEVSRDSLGAFDITLGEVSELWKIGEDGERVPSKNEIAEAIEKVGYENIKINGNSISLESECKVDLGAVGKGAACDIIKKYLESTDVKGAIVSVGGSILAYGSRDKAGTPWSVAITHPRQENTFLGVINLKEGFISTSGDYERYFEQDGVRYHHILDSKTGYPANSGLISVTVVCDNGFLSDALSTACFALGKDEGEKLIEKYGAAAVFVTENEEVYTVGEIDFER